MSVTADQLRRKISGLQAQDARLAAEAGRIEGERHDLAVEIADYETALRIVAREDSQLGDQRETRDELGNDEAPFLGPQELDDGALGELVEQAMVIPPEMIAEAEEIVREREVALAAIGDARTIADACEIGLRFFGGEASGKQLYRLLLQSGRLTQNGDDPTKAYGRMAGMLRKTRARFQRNGYARWRLREVPT